MSLSTSKCFYCFGIILSSLILLRELFQTTHTSEWGKIPMPYLMDCAYRNDIDAFLDYIDHCVHWEMSRGQEPTVSQRL